MCLYPRIIMNKKYLPNKKNKGIIPSYSDERVKYVTIGCNQCIECIKKNGRDWTVRLYEEIKHNTNCKFVTLTFSNESLEKISKILKPNATDNDKAGYAIRHFLENWRKKYGKSLRHWLITELGHNGTERIHIHGLLFTDEIEEIKSKWFYGYSYVGSYVSQQTVNYIVKYITKKDFDHMNFKPQIFSSAGIGSNYLNNRNKIENQIHYDVIDNKLVTDRTNEMYRNAQGYKIPLPIYFRNKIYSERDRENLWLDKLDKQTRFVMGIKVDVSTHEGEIMYSKLVKQARIKNKKLGYKDIDWNEDDYTRKNHAIKHTTIIKKCISLNQPIKNRKEEFYGNSSNDSEWNCSSLGIYFPNSTNHQDLESNWEFDQLGEKNQ